MGAIRRDEVERLRQRQTLIASAVAVVILLAMFVLVRYISNSQQLSHPVASLQDRVTAPTSAATVAPTTVSVGVGNPAKSTVGGLGKPSSPAVQEQAKTTLTLTSTTLKGQQKVSPLTVPRQPQQTAKGSKQTIQASKAQPQQKQIKQGTQGIRADDELFPELRSGKPVSYSTGLQGGLL